ncbi:MAG: glycosyltransferase [Patescibacteria group bacterium]|jgi:glycosyltransferase involved in cell wall biosynthesis
MKVLIIGSDRNLFKPNSDVYQRLVKYSQLVDRIFVVVFTKKGFTPVTSNSKLKIYPTNSKTKFCYIYDAWKLSKKIVAQEKIDIVSTQDPFESGLVGYWLKKKFNLGLNLQLHGDYFGQHNVYRTGLLNSCRLFLAKFLLPQADSIRTVSKKITASLAQFKISLAKIITVPIFIDCQKIANAPVQIDLHKEFPGQFIILAVGRLVSVKNFGLLIESIDLLVKDYSQVMLVIVGSGSEEEDLKLKAKSLILENKVLFYGWKDDLASFYKTADVLVVTSKSEGYMRTPIEAASCGLPTITTDVTPAGEVILDNINGFVLPNMTAESLAAKLLDLAKDPALRQRLSRQVLLTVNSLPSEQDNLDLYLKSWQLAQLPKK